LESLAPYGSSTVEASQKKEPEMPGKDRKRWTVLSYMVADDPQGGQLLDRRAVMEMDQITKAALSIKRDKDVRVAMQIDFRTLPGVWRRVIGEDTFVRPESNAADPATLYGFFDWAVSECPAEHYLLIFWGHSRGQFGMFGDSDPFDYTAQTLTLEELRDALSAAKRSLQKPVDLIAFKDCFMANLEIAYELNGLADYLLASPGLVPVEGWPYEEMFEALTDDGALKAAHRILDALRKHYAIKKNRDPHDEVAYSLLSTAGAVPVVEALGKLVGKDRTSVDQADTLIRPTLDQAARAPGDKALADLGQLVGTAGVRARAAKGGKPQQRPTSALTKKQVGELTKSLNVFIQALGNARPNNAGASIPSIRQLSSRRNSNGLVIDHTGKDFGGVSVFVFPKSTKDQRDSMLTRLANEKAYRRLAISKDTKWADIALRQMPVQQFRPTQDASKGIAWFEQLARLGVGMDPRAAARASIYLRRRARLSRRKELTEADVTEAAQYAGIAELAVRLADFAAEKGADDFAGEKGTDDFAGEKGTDDFAGEKGTDDFGPR
jgi:Clostripain family